MFLTGNRHLPARVTSDARPQAGRNAVPHRSVLLQVGRPGSLRPRHLAHVRSPRSQRALSCYFTPPLSRTQISMKTAQIIESQLLKLSNYTVF